MPVYRISGRNVLFIHVPKTGGTSVEAFLGSHAEPALHNRGTKLLRPVRENFLLPSLPMQHFHAALLESMFPAGFFDYAFMIVRHPMQRLISEYGHSRALHRIDAVLPFGLWGHMLLNVRAMAPAISNNHYRPQHEFRCFDAEVFRFEDGIPHIMRQVAARLGLPEPELAPHEKRSSMRIAQVPPSLSARVARVYAADYAAFGYDNETDGKTSAMARPATD